MRVKTEEQASWPTYSRNIHVAYSQDGGRTWQEQKHEVPILAPAEPAMLLHEGALILIGRSHHPIAYDRKTWTTPYIQHWSKSGWFPLQSRLTNMRCTDRKKERKAGKGLDTVDLSFNPVTKRLEVLATDRMGGGIDARRWSVSFSLNLWSIDPEALLAGSAEWRFEGCLFDRQAEGSSSLAMGDGCHPASAVIDEQQGGAARFCLHGTSGRTGWNLSSETYARHGEVSGVSEGVDESLKPKTSHNCGSRGHSDAKWCCPPRLQ